ncbi:MAG: hypothetical protein NDJ89_02545 [Oligoflexia bacterium]|nr:hypothetical protein [Oligoflexia bacterium]
MVTRLILASMLLAAAAGTAFAEIGGGDIKFEVKGESDVVFSHADHVRDNEVKCTACHDKLYLNVKKHRKVSAKQMNLGESCGKCHNGKDAKINVADKSRCTECHEQN